LDQAVLRKLRQQKPSEFRRKQQQRLSVKLMKLSAQKLKRRRVRRRLIFLLQSLLGRLVAVQAVALAVALCSLRLLGRASSAGSPDERPFGHEIP
jgi:hypothetical protein